MSVRRAAPSTRSSRTRISRRITRSCTICARRAFPREAVGTLPTELVKHFFHSLADQLGATLHMRVTGDNTHHMIESLFKAFGRALRPAVARTTGGDVPSTKGVL
jgi:imidazoleglycerol-phosphate dehydratase/histidinol-phosphatase